MTQLILYNEAYNEITVRMIAEFFAEHQAISEKLEIEIDDGRLLMAKDNLKDWLGEREDEDLCTHVFLIEEDYRIVGFLILKKHGGNVIWIEDLYVSATSQGQGIGSRAIQLVEQYVANTMNVRAICMDIVPQNERAMKLYHRLGYDTISTITLRKSVGEKKKTQKVEFMGYEFFK